MTAIQSAIEPCYYFGCGLFTVGHYLFGPAMSSLRYHPEHRSDPFGLLDGSYTKKTVPMEDEKKSFLTHKDGWTLLAMWDRSMDTRYASNCCFFCQGLHDEDEMWKIAYTWFPQIVERLQERRRG